VKQKEKQQTLSFFVCSFVVPNSLVSPKVEEKKTFPSPVAIAFCLTSKNALLKGMLNFF